MYCITRLAKYYYDKMQEDTIGDKRSNKGEKRNVYKISVGKHERTRPFRRQRRRSENDFTGVVWVRTWTNGDVL